MRNRIQLIALLLALPLAFVACEDDDDTSGGVTGPDTTPPVIWGVDAIDVNHIEVTFNENIERASAENSDNCFIVEFVGAPVDTLEVVGAALKNNSRTVVITTSAMNDAPHVITVDGIADATGNQIGEPVQKTFAGTDNPDMTRPEIAYFEPHAQSRIVATDADIFFTFTEPIKMATFLSGATITTTAGPIVFTAQSDDSLHVSVVPSEPLDPDTRYTVELNDIEDLAGNVMNDITWWFQTLEPQ